MLNKVAEFLHPSNKKALDAIGGESGLEEIIKANVRAGCSTCGKASTSFLKNMDEYLDDVLYFGNTFAGKEGFDKVIKELKVINKKNKDPNYAVEGATFMLRKIRETPEITANSVRRFDGIFEGEIDKICLNCRFDIELISGKKFEYKSYGPTSISSISSSDIFLRQHLSYLEETTSLDNILYEFDKLKFSDRDKVVEQFRKMYEKNAEQIFKPKSQGGLGESKIKELFGNKINSIDDFLDEIENINSPIYKFIKVD
ncbi:hypothetical protein [Myroides sp. N17-2]|uniref:hypothetical protein n=1 Tax=Myroides sp. N17-2 TaxID=2030799 RepID=UPI000EFD005F|nr:hypothetical protein [Myroides sp. N17-2]